jgi:GNAT superfamily N-acetyltransferase
MVRDGTPEDLPQVVLMAAEFWKETRYDDPFDPEHVRNMAAMALDHGLLAILEIDGRVEGFTAGVKGPLLGNASVLSGTEIAWWVNPSARRGRNGIALMQHIEGMARAQGVKYWNMVVMESCMPEVGATIYERLGYEKSETSYTRVL